MSVVILPATLADVADERDGVRQDAAGKEETNEKGLNGYFVCPLKSFCPEFDIGQAKLKGGKMSVAKIQIKVGVIEFSGEGEEQWIEVQLDKILAKASDLLKLAPPAPSGGGAPGMVEDAVSGTDVPLATFFKNKSVGNNQVKRFLATAIWLSGKGRKTLSTRDIVKSLSDNHHARLGNPADSLNKNVAKGYCEKQGDEFYVTPEGFESMQ